MLNLTVLEARGALIYWRMLSLLPDINISTSFFTKERIKWQRCPSGLDHHSPEFFDLILSRCKHLMNKGKSSQYSIITMEGYYLGSKTAAISDNLLLMSISF